ncbi:uncharacterized protein [Amphiura filiformis]|uniref:uncharacterized protein n=1 Tax=Amphiura filiformis TaxID=82378 RepID=UPI003B22716D
MESIKEAAQGPSQIEQAQVIIMRPGSPLEEAQALTLQNVQGTEVQRSLLPQEQHNVPPTLQNELPMPHHNDDCVRPVLAPVSPTNMVTTTSVQHRVPSPMKSLMDPTIAIPSQLLVKPSTISPPAVKTCNQLNVPSNPKMTTSGSKEQKKAPALACLEVKNGGKEETNKKPANIPCKDREFDANKHCGVWIEDTKRQCTRSITCKIHWLGLRRKVEGRRKPLDDLLKEHRAAKEILVAERKAPAKKSLPSPIKIRLVDDIPCKDREFDANKHCGVWIEDTKRQCMKSLTCRTHTHRQRREVEGRQKPFDELLKMSLSKESQKMSEAYISVKRTSILDLLRQNKDLSVEDLGPLVFQAICQEKSVDLNYTKRLDVHLRSKINRFMSIFGLKPPGKPPYSWICKVLASEFESGEQYENFCRATDGSGIETSLDAALMNKDIKMCFEDSKYQNKASSSGEDKNEVDLNVSSITVLDVVRQNLHLPSEDVASLAFHAICQEKSLELKYTERLERQIMKCTSALKQNLINEDGTVVYLWIKVLGSEFVSEEQFHQICEENKHQQKPTNLLSWHNPFGPTSVQNVHVAQRAETRAHKRKRACGEFGNGKDDNMLGKQSETRENQQKRAQDVTQKAGKSQKMAEVYLLVKHTTILDVVRENLNLQKKDISWLVFDAICQENSVDLIYSSRFESQLNRYVKKLRSNFKLTHRKSWLWKVLASEFESQEQYEHLRRAEKRKKKKWNTK